MFLEIDFKSDLPIYEQIRRGIIIGLAKGEINPGDKLPRMGLSSWTVGLEV